MGDPSHCEVMRSLELAEEVVLKLVKLSDSAEASVAV
jgi:hypothetical protein